MGDESARVLGEAVEQLSVHWDSHLWPKLDQLSDEEYLWEPVDGCWNLRRRVESDAGVQGGSGEFTVDFAYPEPSPAPVTTIAWRLAHLIVGIFGTRAANHFGAPAIDYLSHEFAGSAAEALTQLDATYNAWMSGVRSMAPERLWEPVGPSEGPYSDIPYLALILHINREAIHHGAEILVLRDLYRARRMGERGPIT